MKLYTTSLYTANRIAVQQRSISNKFEECTRIHTLLTIPIAVQLEDKTKGNKTKSAVRGKMRGWRRGMSPLVSGVAYMFSEHLGRKGTDDTI